MAKKYRQIETNTLIVKEPAVAYVSPQKNSHVNMEERNNIELAISGNELLNRLRPRIKALFK